MRRLKSYAGSSWEKRTRTPISPERIAELLSSIWSPPTSAITVSSTTVSANLCIEFLEELTYSQLRQELGCGSDMCMQQYAKRCNGAIASPSMPHYWVVNVRARNITTQKEDLRKERFTTTFKQRPRRDHQRRSRTKKRMPKSRGLHVKKIQIEG